MPRGVGWMGGKINSGHKTEYRDSIRLSGGFFDQQLDLPRTMSNAKKTNRGREKNQKQNRIDFASLAFPSHKVAKSGGCVDALTRKDNI